MVMAASVLTEQLIRESGTLALCLFTLAHIEVHMTVFKVNEMFVLT